MVMMVMDKLAQLEPRSATGFESAGRFASSR